uniref:Uncharacterized protein n=1 Tax=Avena sativa TaxID=4498 RepID=A0ACD5TJB1_AVESA
MAQADHLSLSIHAMDGTAGRETLKLWAMIGNQVLIILVDSGSSHSFVNANLVERLHCTVKTTASVPVKIANGSYMQCTEMVPQLTWWCQGETFSTDMRVLQLGVYDAILGMDWLELHSPMVTDWKNHCLAFSHNGQFIKLTGVAAPVSERVKELPVEQLIKWYKGNEIWAMAIVHPSGDNSSSPLPSEISEVLAQFLDVFATPTKLPPERECPYRYSPAHKDEIEKQVKAMLEAVFMDDILVYSASLQDHVQHLTEVLTLLRRNKLFVKDSKCSFACLSLEYLGHIILADGVSTDPRKTEAMVKWPQPTTVTELRGFLGLTGYYRKFVRNYAVIARPLTNLLKKWIYVDRRGDHIIHYTEGSNGVYTSPTITKFPEAIRGGNGCV